MLLHWGASVTNTSSGLAIASGDMQIERLSIWFLSAIDLGSLIKHGDAARKFMAARGRPGWLKSVYEAMNAESEHGFDRPEIEESAYCRTDRHGRRTFSSHFAAGSMPITFKLRRPKVHLTGPLRWSVEERKFFCDSVSPGAARSRL